MAIYTNYARYLKAKEFKKMIEDQGDTYMLLGLGNPFWDSTTDETAAKMPVAPYNTDIMTGITGWSYNSSTDTYTNGDPLSADQNQFSDTEAYQYFSVGTASIPPSQTVQGGVPKGNYINAVRSMLPPFPCLWQPSTARTIYASTSNTSQSITTSDYHKFYLKKDGADIKMFNLDGGGSWDNPENMPTGDGSEFIIYRQAYADMYLRGLAIGAGIKHPIGLLGAVRCNINFVKDIGADDSIYTGDVKQIWYGDRYWEIYDKDPLDSETQEPPSMPEYVSLPHHLLFNATINPMQLCSELNIDQNIVPRQIAIFVRKRKEEHHDAIDGQEAWDELVRGPKYYPVNDKTIFNFGQYTASELEDTDVVGTGEHQKTVLNFTLPVKISDGGTTTEYPGGEDTDFKFILNDYIKGSVRDKHSIDRIGYILGF